jgi:hypothetical protein
MDYLDDLYLFKQVVDCNGISSASRHLGIAKSTLSRRLNALESRLGSSCSTIARANFSSRTLASRVTKCTALVDQAEQIHSMAEQVRALAGDYISFARR